MYSTSTLDRATIVCFLLFQVIRLPLKNVQYPVVDHLSEGEHAQSTSVKPSTLRCPFDLYNIPKPGCLFKYRIMRVTASQCEIRGAFKN
jgi:hypothetical protein